MYVVYWWYVIYCADDLDSYVLYFSVQNIHYSVLKCSVVNVHSNAYGSYFHGIT